MSMENSFETFRKIIARLRAPDGCPWDKKQTHTSLKPYFIEETYEALQAIDEKDPRKLCEELGDILLQIGLHAQIASEAGEFDLTDVVREINEKLIRRHPHVFGDLKVIDAEEVSRIWGKLKREEGKNSILSGLPKTMPALAQSQALQRRAAQVGFDWKEFSGVLEKVVEELEELKQAKTQEERISEFGDLLFALTNVARWIEIDLESALHLANERFCKRFSYIEDVCQKRGVLVQELSLEELDILWKEAKEWQQKVKKSVKKD